MTSRVSHAKKEILSGLQCDPLSEVALFVDRLIKDWDRQPVGLKKSWGYREAAQLHAVCGAFIHYTNVLKAKISEETYQAELPGLKEQFAGSFLDPELLHSLQSSVPPGDISSISVLRQGLLQNWRFVFRSHQAPQEFHIMSPMLGLAPPAPTMFPGVTGRNVSWHQGHREGLRATTFPRS